MPALMLTLVVVLVMTLALSLPVVAAEEGDAQDAPPASLDFTMKSITGKDVSLSGQYAGKVVLMVNVASKCGHTKQYADLQALHEKYADEGLAILGFPCNQFGGQEPGSEEEIATFCKKNYGVTFDLFEKIEVKGDDAAPLFAYLTSDRTGLADTGPVKWNFEKFLIGRDGAVIARYRSKIKPGSDDVVAAIEQALAAAKE